MQQNVSMWNSNDPCFDWKVGLVLGGWPSKIEVIWVPGIVYLRHSKGRRRIECETCYEIKISMLNLDTNTYLVMFLMNSYHTSLWCQDLNHQGLISLTVTTT